MLLALDARCRGFSHINDGKPCQDSCESFADNYIGLAIVADGHGGDKYIRSAQGSHEAVFRSKIFAYKMIKGNLESFIKKKDTKAIEKNLALLKSHIIREWREVVANHYALNPLTADELTLCEKAKIALPIPENAISELYGTTLLVCGYIEKYNFWFSLQIGDGKTVILKEDGSVTYPIPEDSEQAFGVTHSLCKSNAGEKFHHAFGFEKIAGICVMSDGLTDSFDTEKLPAFLLNIKNNALQSAEKTKQELIAYLPKLSEQGSGDDISIAGIFVREEERKLQKIVNKVGRLV